MLHVAPYQVNKAIMAEAALGLLLALCTGTLVSPTLAVNVGGR